MVMMDMSDEFDAVKELFEDSTPTRAESGRLRADLMDHIANTELATHLRTYTSSADVDEVTVRRLRKRLDHHIETTSRSVRRRWAFALGAAAAIVAMVSVGLWLGGPANPAQALLDVAQATQALPNDEFAGATVERSVDQLVLQVEPKPGGDATVIAYQLPISQIIRTAPDGSFQITTSYRQLRFFEPTPTDVADALQEPFPPGQPETFTFPPQQPDPDTDILTGDPAVLADRVTDRIQRFGPEDVPTEVQVLELVSSLFGQAVPTPQQRAAMLRVIADTDGIAYMTDAETGAVTATADHHYEDGTPVRLSLTFDRHGWLIRKVETLLDGYPELAVPAGTPASDTRYQPPTVLSP